MMSYPLPLRNEIVYTQEDGISQQIIVLDGSSSFRYPLVNVYITMEHRHFQIFNSHGELPEGTFCYSNVAMEPGREAFSFAATAISEALVSRLRM